VDSDGFDWHGSKLSSHICYSLPSLCGVDKISKTLSPFVGISRAAVTITRCIHWRRISVNASIRKMYASICVRHTHA